MEKTPSWTLKWGGTTTVLVLILLLNLSWVIKYPNIVKGEVFITTMVSPEKHHAVVFGKIDTLFITNRANVNSGDIIAIIQNNANYNDVLMLSRILDTISLNDKSFYATSDLLSNLNLGSIESSYAEFENSFMDFAINSIYAFQGEKLTARKKSMNDMDNKIRSLQLQWKQQRKETDFFKKSYSRYKKLFDKGVVSLSEYEAKEIEYLNSEKKLIRLSSELYSAKDSRNAAFVNFTDSDLIAKRQNSFLKNNLTQNYNKLIGALEEWKQKYVVKSSIDGKVIFNGFWNPKKTVNQGDLICTVLPKKSDFTLKIKTVQKGLGNIKVGFKVNIDLDNYPAYENGYLHATILTIPILPEEDGSYILDAKLTDGLITSYGKKILFSQEMSGTAEIITEKTSLAKKLFFPFKNLNKY